MKNYLIVIFLLFHFFAFSQKSEIYKEINAEFVAFKAKLFTISQHQYLSQIELINNIEKMPFESYGDKEFIFFKINGRYYCRNDKSYYKTDWCDRTYYLCYSIERDYYYLLGGFTNNNIKEFIKDFSKSQSTFRIGNYTKDENLNNFIRLINLEKIRKANSFMGSVSN